jgi:hypothetical protein
MHEHTTAIERSFELARSGRFPSVAAICQRLRAEGYRTNQIEGPMLIGQLNNMIREAGAVRGHRFNPARQT